MAEREYANCPQCNYSAPPDEVLGQERKHFHAHSLRCVRCLYQTETKWTWIEAKRAWNKGAAAATAKRCPMIDDRPCHNPACETDCSAA